MYQTLSDVARCSPHPSSAWSAGARTFTLRVSLTSPPARQIASLPRASTTSQGTCTRLSNWGQRVTIAVLNDIGPFSSTTRS